MGIEIAMTGSGELGPIAPGWSVQEFATPVTIGDSAGGTGNVSFTAASTDTSLFVVNNEITTSEESLGFISGTVKSVSETGINTSVSHNTPLAAFDATKDIPALGSGSVYAALDLCNQLSGRQKYLTLPEGRLYSLAGHSAGFDFNNDLVTSDVTEVEYETYYYWSGGFVQEYYREQYGRIWANSFANIGGETYATHVYGDNFSNKTAQPYSRIAFKARPNGSNVVFTTGGGPNNINAELYGTTMTVTVNPVAKTLTIYAEHQTIDPISGLPETQTVSTSIASLNMNTELAIFIDYRIPTVPFSKPLPPDSVYIMDVSICNTTNYSSPINLVMNFGVPINVYNLPWGITGNVRSIYRNQTKDMLVDWIGEYEEVKDFTVTGTYIAGPPVAALAGVNMWDYLQQACSAYEYELAVINDVITAMPIAERIIDITNKTVPTISPTMTLSGRSIDIVYSNAENIVDQEIYSARADNNRIISVNANETITVTVPIAGTPTIVNLPYRGVTPVNGAGEYTIIQANGTQVPQSAWSNYGGRVKVDISTTAVNALDITFVGPNVSDGVFGGSSPTYVGPFKLAYSSGSTEYAALSIIGTGIKTNVQTLNLDTGSDRTKVFQDVAKTITNVFINTKEQAYDRGIWVSSDTSGPRVTLSATIPVSEIQGFGLAAGSRIWYRDSIYRITDATIGNLAVSFNAVRHVTAEDFDLVWAGGLVGEHDETWEGFDASDHSIAPLRRIGYDESVLMFLDEDITPYYDFSGEPEISVFGDTDTNPYYEDGGNLDGEDPVYLDSSDDNPYV